jgi:lipopolysaccharide export system permease protein
LRRILDRYILREVVAGWAVVTGVLLVILLSKQLADTLERAAASQYPRDVVFELIGLGALQNLGVVLPVGLLLGVMLAFGRLYHDSEMAAMFACGVPPRRLYLPVTAFALLVTAGLAWLTLVLAPAAMGRTFSLRNEALRAGQFAPLAPGKFRTFGGGDAVVYAEAVDVEGVLSNVFVERTQDQRVEVAVAERARHQVAADGMTHTITLYDGERFEGVPGTARFRIVRFAEHTIPVQVPPLAGEATRLETVPTVELLRSSDREKRAELHWRVGLPVMCLVLTLLAIPISRLKPRQGRYSRVYLGVVIYFVYSNLASAGKVWLARGKMPEPLGLWWVHVAVVVLGLSLLWLPRLVSRARYRRPA